MDLPRSPVSLDQLLDQLAEYRIGPDGSRHLTRRSVHRLARAAWRAERRGLLIEPPPRMERPGEGSSAASSGS